MSDKKKQSFIRKLSNDAQSFLLQGKNDEALNCYKKILDNYPKEIPTLYSIGMVYYELGDYEKAVDYFDQILDQNELNIDALYAKGTILSHLQQNEKAITILDKVLNLNPKMVLAWLAKGYTLLNMDNPKDALTCFEKVDDLNEGINTSSAKGHVFRKLDETEKAKAWYMKGYKADPYDPDALLGLGIIEFQLDNLKQAQDYLYRCVIQDEENLDAWKTLAKIYKQTKQNKRYKVAIDKITELDNLRK